MAYTDVPSKSDGNTITASEWNTYIKDNYEAGVPDIFTAPNQIAVASGNKAAIAVSPGAGRSFLTANSGAASGVEWKRIPKAIIGLAGTQNIPPSLLTTVNFNTLHYSDGMTVNLASDYIQIPSTGRYTMIYEVEVSRLVPYDQDDFPTLGSYVNLLVFGIEVERWTRDNSPARWNSLRWSGTISRQLTAGNQITMTMFLNRSGYLGPLSISNALLTCYLAE